MTWLGVFIRGNNACNNPVSRTQPSRRFRFRIYHQNQTYETFPHNLRDISLKSDGITPLRGCKERSGETDLLIEYCSNMVHAEKSIVYMESIAAGVELAELAGVRYQQPGNTTGDHDLHAKLRFRGDGCLDLWHPERGDKRYGLAGCGDLP